MKTKKYLFLLLGLQLLFLGSCCDDNTEVLINEPTVNTINAINTNDSSSTINAEITNNGGGTITERGVCWSTQTNPTINDNKKMDSGTSNSFTIDLVDLLPLTTYYVKVYAVNEKGIGYGNTVSFTTLNNTTTLTLQPGAEGKDASYRSLIPTENNGNAKDFNTMAWTNSGTPVYVRSVIDFDFSTIPDGSTIESAILSLWNDSTSLNNSGKHSEAAVYPLTGGDNGAYLRRITSTWDESTVTWNTQPTTTTINQVSILPSTDPHQDYPTIDVTTLVQDIINNKSTSFGLMLILQTEVYYRGLILASSDNLDPTKRPKLVVVYK